MFSFCVKNDVLVSQTLLLYIYIHKATVTESPGLAFGDLSVTRSMAGTCSDDDSVFSVDEATGSPTGHKYIFFSSWSICLLR